MVLRDGKNAGELDRDEISHDSIVRLMVGRDIDVAHDAASNKAAAISASRCAHAALPAAAVSFDAGRGEILGFAGLVGAGRSEMAQAMFGLDPPMAGTVSLGGRPCGSGGPRTPWHGIYLVPEDRRPWA